MRGGYRRLAQLPVVTSHEGDVSQPLQNASLSKFRKFLETASIRLRCVAGLDGGTSTQSCSLAACRRSRCHTRTTPTLSSPTTKPPTTCACHRARWRNSASSVVARSSTSSAAASCTPWPTSMLGRKRAASRPLPTPNMPSTTRLMAVRADRRIAGGHRHVSPTRARDALQQREQLDLFRALPGEDMAPRDAQDLMAYPFFLAGEVAAHRADRLPQRHQHHHSTWKARRSMVLPPSGMPTSLIWAASQIVEAKLSTRVSSRPGGCRPRPTRSCASSGAANRCATCSVSRPRWISCNRPQWPRPSAKPTGRRLHRFSWINEWKELADARVRRWASS